MILKSALVSLFAAAAAASAQDVFFQQKVAGPPPDAEAGATEIGPGGPVGAVTIGGPAFGFVSHEFTAGLRQVTGAPYSADETTESVQTLSDGNRIVNSTTAHTYRDSQGRVRREITLPSLGADSAKHVLITISDPVAGVNYSLDPQTKTAQKMPLPPKLLTKGPGPGKPETRTNVMFLPGPGLQVQMAAPTHAQIAPPTHEDLGVQDIDGVSAQGSRETTTIDAGAIGNEKPLTITSEHWFSPDLQIEIKSTREDPRMGKTTFAISNLNRAEPDASLFQVPADYTLHEPKAVQSFEYKKLP
jgi:hypothetical protein